MDKETKKVTYYIPIDLYERLRLESFQTREPHCAVMLVYWY
mgnify:CR=1 FL=1